MDLKCIFLKKDTNKTTKLKSSINVLLKSIFITEDNSLKYEYQNSTYSLEHNISSDSASNLVYLDIKIDGTPMICAKIIDEIRLKINQDTLRKNFYMITTYDGSSDLLCQKLYPKLGQFERLLREIVYYTIVKIFGINWFEKSFSQNLKNDLKSKANTQQLIERALNELDIHQLESYLFDPFIEVSFENVLHTELSDENISTMSKEDIVDLLGKCKNNKCLWERFFDTLEFQIQNINSVTLEDIRKYRNTVMHSKFITYSDYVKCKNLLSQTNRSLSLFSKELENSRFSEIQLYDVIASFGSMLTNFVTSDTFKNLLIGISNAIKSISNASTITTSINHSLLEQSKMLSTTLSTKNYPLCKTTLSTTLQSSTSLLKTHTSIQALELSVTSPSLSSVSTTLRNLK